MPVRSGPEACVWREPVLRRKPVGAYTWTMRQTPPSRPSTRSVHPGRRKTLCFAFVLPWTVLVAGCGQKGPLYHPPEPREEKKVDKTSTAPPVPGSRLA